MNLRDKYVTNKRVLFYPGDTYRKEGYIRDVDELGWTWEVTKAQDPNDLGIRFSNHAMRFTYKELEE